MVDIFKPDTDQHIEDAVTWAAANDKKLAIKGGGSKPGLGHDVCADAVLDLSAMDSIWSWEPEELVLTAGPGVKLDELTATLAEKGQVLAFAPPSWQGLYEHAGTATLGGVLACNLAGSRRLTAGAARDHFLGVTAIGGRAEIFKAGGRVVKNVTGYDVCKILAGSHGSLAAMAIVTVKVLPKPETEETLIVESESFDQAQGIMAGLMRGSFDVSSLCYVPGANGVGHVHARFEGVPPSVLARRAAAEDMLKGQAISHRQDDPQASADFWTDCGELGPIMKNVAASDAVWRVSVQPSEFARLATMLKGLLNEPSHGLPASWFADWAGGLFYIAAPTGLGMKIGTVCRDFVARHGGHATILRDNSGLSLPRFQPENAAIDILSNRIKTAFDPEFRLNPGRMTGREGGR